ncbi:thioredoxin [Desulfogranum japonicum]|uniref:thioredoxin n=1 Tax=Desulfogranum japonicum TaxID=231447 RepID=UPI0003F7B332|nr:thioredoxin [Desulfogranum japonicum]
MPEALAVCANCGAKNRIPAGKEYTEAKCGKCRASLQSAALTGVVRHINDQNFQAVVMESNLPVLVDFFSPTCGPCKMIAPVIENIAGKYAGKIVIAKLDTSVSQMTASRFQIRGVPTLLFFKGGEVRDQVVGAVPQAEIESKLNGLL